MKKTILLTGATLLLCACGPASYSSSSQSSLIDSSSQSISFIDESSSSESSSSASAEIKQLRNVDDADHSYSYNRTKESGYLEFKQKLNDFAMRISEILVSDDDLDNGDNVNLAFSPLSLELCLGLAVRSTSGSSRQEILDAFGLDYETFNSYYSLFFNTAFQKGRVQPGNDEVFGSLLLNNSIWIDTLARPNDDCLDALASDYYCDSFAADFHFQNEKSNQAITDYIYEKTNGLLSPNLDLSTETLFVLMNTLYLKDIWSEGRVLNRADKSYQFHNDDGTVSQKDLLHGTYAAGRALVKEDFSTFYTYSDTGFRIQFILPSSGKDIKDVFNKENIALSLDRNNYQFVDSEKKERYNTACIFPEWTGGADIDLERTLVQDFSIASIFGMNADFSPLSKDFVFCDAIRQVAKLEVNDKGIEGAAVTYMAITGAAGPGEEELTDVYEVFPLQKEFGFILTDPSNNIVFSGLVSHVD